MNTKEKNILKELFVCISKKADIKVFINQVIFFRVTAVLPVEDDENGFEISKIVKQIQNYLEEDFAKFKGRYEQLHQIIFEEICAQNNKVEGIDFRCEEKLYNRKVLRRVIPSQMKTQVSDFLSGKRRFHKKWYRELKRSNQEINEFVKRIFWILQYFYAVYGDSGSITRNLNKKTTEQLYEYYQLIPEKREKLYAELKKVCGNMTIMQNITADELDTRVFARIIVECILEHINFIEYKNIDLNEKDRNDNFKGDRLTRFEYEQKIAIYDRTTMDWFHVCQKYSKSNYIAATELANVYFSGTSLQAGEICRLEITKDYAKAVSLYQKAIALSDPPYAPACWNMGILLTDNFYSYIEGKKAGETAKRYFEMCGDYAPAMNSMAKMMLKEDMRKYEENENCDTIAENVVKALVLAYEASEKGWLYGNNVIANFLQHTNQTRFAELLKKVKKKWDKEIELEPIIFLERAAVYNNPWAMYQLANEYIKNKRMNEAYDLLERAYNLNFYMAYCPYAIHFKTGEEQARILKEASNNRCALATYECAMRLAQNDEEKRMLLDRALNQVLMMRVIDENTHKKILQAMRKVNV